MEYWEDEFTLDYSIHLTFYKETQGLNKFILQSKFRELIIAIIGFVEMILSGCWGHSQGVAMVTGTRYISKAMYV